MDQLGVITPCRVFQKINFLDEVKRRLTQSQNALLLQDLRTELNGFFRREVSTSNSVANLTMALNMIESFSDSSGLNFSKNEQEKIDQIIDDIRWATIAVDGVEECEVITTFDPPFGPEMMSEDAKLILGVFASSGKVVI